MDDFQSTLDFLIQPPPPSAPSPEALPERNTGPFGAALDFLIQPDLHARELDAARRQVAEKGPSSYAGMPEDKGTDVGQFIVKNSLPYISAGLKQQQVRQYGEAAQRFQNREATPEDMKTIAEFEHRDREATKRTTLQAVGHGVAEIPAILGELAAGGTAVRGLGLVKGTGIGARAAAGALATPAMPSTFLEAGARNKLANPDESDFQAYAPAVAMAMAQNAVLGQLQGLFNAAPISRLGRIGAKTVVGMGESAAADVATTGLDRVTKEVTGKSLGLDTKWGTLGAVLRGDEGSKKAATVQFLTFSVFSAMHSGREIPHEVFQKATKAAKPEQVAEVGRQVQEGKFDPETPGPLGDLGRQYADVVESALKAHEGSTEKSAVSAPGVRPDETPQKPAEAAPEPPGQVPSQGEIAPPDASGEAAGAKSALPDVLKASGLNKRIDPKASGETGTVLNYGDRFMILKHDLASNRVEINFDFDNSEKHDAFGPIPSAKEFRGDSRELLRDIKKIALGLHDRGIGIEYSAAQDDPAGQPGVSKRDAAYGRKLESAGFERESREVGKTMVTAVWRPKAKEPAPSGPIEDKVKLLPTVEGFQKRFKITDKQMEAVNDAIRGITYEDAGGEHGGVSRQAIHDRIKRATEKLGLTAGQRQELFDLVQNSQAADRALELQARGGQVEAGDLGFDPAEVGRAGSKARKAQSAQAAADKAQDRIFKELKKPGLSEARRTELWDEYAKLADPYQDRTTGMGAANASPAQEQFVKEVAGPKWVNGVRDFVRKLGGAKLAATRRLSEKAADAGANVDRSRLYGEAQAELLNDQVQPESSATLDLIAGAVYTEMQLRNTKAHYQSLADKALMAGDHAKAKEYAELAAGVGTNIGADPLPREQDFQEWSKNQEVVDILARADQIITPVTEGLFREALGMKPGEAIPAGTMIDRPGIPKLSLVSLRSTDVTPAEKLMGALPAESGPSGPGRGNLRRHQATKLGASKQRTGSAEHGYESSLREIVRRNLVDRQVNADKNQFFRTWEAEGVGRMVKPGEKLPDGWKKLESVKPFAQDGKTDFQVKEGAYPDARQLLEPKEQKWQFPLLVASTWANLRSAADFVAHTKNVLTQWTRGARLRDIADGLKGQILGDETIRREIVELARLSALSERHLDLGTGLGRFDPSHYAGKVLGIMDRAVRVASLRAYDRMVKRGLDIDNTDAGRRDFINQIGNYSKLTQNRAVAWLRELGIGPFATAGTTFWVHGLRTLALRPGVRSKTWSSQVQLHAEMLARVAVLPVTAAILNYAMFGRADGDDNTPWGAVKLSSEGGRTNYFNLTALSGLDRGAREVGLKAMLEGSRPGAKKAGATIGSKLDHARRDITEAAIHPAIGPGVNVLSVAATGEDALGHIKSHKLTAAEKKAGESQAAYDALAAIFESNSILESFAKPWVTEQLGVKPSEGEKKREGSLGDRLLKNLGPYGPKHSTQPAGAPLKK